MMGASAWTVDATMILSREEIAAVLADLKRKARRSVNTRQNLILFRLATCCGLRVSEIVGLRLSDVRLGVRRPYLYVRKAVAKGGKTRKVPLWWDQGTLADVTTWKAKRQGQGASKTDRFVCSQSKGTHGKPLDRRNARKRFIAGCKVLGQDRQREVTIHTGRHSFVSHALAGGRSLAEVREAAGHANISTTSRYAHVATADEEPGDLFAFGP